MSARERERWIDRYKERARDRKSEKLSYLPVTIPDGIDLAAAEVGPGLPDVDAGRGARKEDTVELALEVNPDERRF